MANNNNLFNAALAGASSGIASRWLTNTNAASYASQAALIAAFATAFDAAVPTDPSGGTRGQCQVVSDICAAFCNGRVLTTAMDMDLVVAPLVALYNELGSSVEPDAGGGGGALASDTFFGSEGESPISGTLDPGTLAFTQCQITGWCVISGGITEAAATLIGNILVELSVDGGDSWIPILTTIPYFAQCGANSPGLTATIPITMTATGLLPAATPLVRLTANDFSSVGVSMLTTVQGVFS